MAYREYPRYVERRSERGTVHLVVLDDAARDVAFRDGWFISTRPYVHVDEEPAAAETSGPLVTEGGQLDELDGALTGPAKRKPGRPRKDAQ